MESESYENLQYARAAQPGLPPSVSPSVSPSGSHGVPHGVSGFLAWLMLWLWLCVERSHRRSEAFPVRPYEPNRHWRRFGGRDIAPVRNNRSYYCFVRPGLSPTQFMERLVALSGRGRVSVYRMRYWRKTVEGKAAPLGTEHENWRDPLGRIGGRMGKLLCGVWYVHLWPGWRFVFSN